MKSLHPIIADAIAPFAPNPCLTPLARAQMAERLANAPKTDSRYLVIGAGFEPHIMTSLPINGPTDSLSRADNVFWDDLSDGTSDLYRIDSDGSIWHATIAYHSVSIGIDNGYHYIDEWERVK